MSIFLVVILNLQILFSGDLKKFEDKVGKKPKPVTKAPIKRPKKSDGPQALLGPAPKALKQEEDEAVVGQSQVAHTHAADAAHMSLTTEHPDTKADVQVQESIHMRSESARDAPKNQGQVAERQDTQPGPNRADGHIMGQKAMAHPTHESGHDGETHTVTNEGVPNINASATGVGQAKASPGQLRTSTRKKGLGQAGINPGHLRTSGRRLARESVVDSSGRGQLGFAVLRRAQRHAKGDGQKAAEAVTVTDENTVHTQHGTNAGARDSGC
ncbi:hypothetical protein SARC_11168 [Sphaeroforma arctica JP610]|uniref:Uncharacterized protein n=1 Tax=Sphaeroforma arctica JP610 TaxID=667725 RepID=A0A0L0FHR6_9EUKA|nr:hypothetical protein SARC_11168 [Sphaeroforma arctica JP610]KNC76327.1 hypothetical protein SARC_11168 [Sphaeroforma arctica JP610]|eukprot:XP_014150229.1 hypothetical protein SARC_11168 [Sphaeroforma arctica JP610]